MLHRSSRTDRPPRRTPPAEAPVPSRRAPHGRPHGPRKPAQVRAAHCSPSGRVRRSAAARAPVRPALPHPARGCPGSPTPPPVSRRARLCTPAPAERPHGPALSQVRPEAPALRTSSYRGTHSSHEAVETHLLPARWRRDARTRASRTRTEPNSPAVPCRSPHLPALKTAPWKPSLPQVFACGKVEFVEEKKKEQSSVYRRSTNPTIGQRGATWATTGTMGRSRASPSWKR